MIKKNIASVVSEIAKPICDSQGLILWDVEYVKEGAKKILRITIDKKDGVNIDDCEKFHRTIDPLIDEADPIDESYYLECTSPGLERELKNDTHIDACRGEKVEVKLFTAKNGSKSYVGILDGLDSDKNVVIDVNGEKIAFLKQEIAKISTVYDF